MKKIWIIGFNKTATTSIHHLIQASGYRSWHQSITHWGSIAKIIERNALAGLPILGEADTGDAYSDLCFLRDGKFVEANKWFKEIYEEYPDAYYVLNTRPMGNWIKSRVNHGDFLQRYIAWTDCSTREEALEQWRANYRSHHAEVESFFKGKKNFLKFDIEEDDIKTLIDFLAPEYKLNPSYWRTHNKTA
jgi:hypothetical protein